MPGLIQPEVHDNLPDHPIPNQINKMEDKSITNVFCISAFADKVSGAINNNYTATSCTCRLTGTYVSLLCTITKNAILITPVAGLDLECILEAYKKSFEYLVSKGTKPKVNIMDNQATTGIKAYFTPQPVTLQLVEPHNQRVQTFKNRFNGALEQLTVSSPSYCGINLQDCINLLCHPCILPTKLVYETLEGPYDYNCYPLAPLGTRAIIYKD